VQGRPADGCSFRQDRYGNTPPPPRIVNVVPELSERTCYRYRDGCEGSTVAHIYCPFQ
jgi:hypothetical protein